MKLRERCKVVLSQIKSAFQKLRARVKALWEKRHGGNTDQ